MSGSGRPLTEPAADAAIASACRVLHLPTLRERFAELADAAARERLSYRAFLSELLLAEIDERDARRRERRVREAGFPLDKRLADFDFGFNPAISPAVVSTLATGAWVAAGEPLCLVGDSGTGKMVCRL